MWNVFFCFVGRAIPRQENRAVHTVKKNKKIKNKVIYLNLKLVKPHAQLKFGLTCSCSYLLVNRKSVILRRKEHETFGFDIQVTSLSTHPLSLILFLYFFLHSFKHYVPAWGLIVCQGIIGFWMMNWLGLYSLSVDKQCWEKHQCWAGFGLVCVLCEGEQSGRELWVNDRWVFKTLTHFCRAPVSFILTEKISLSLISGDVIITVNSVYIAGFTHQQIKDLVQKSSTLM